MRLEETLEECVISTKLSVALLKIRSCFHLPPSEIEDPLFENWCRTCCFYTPHRHRLLGPQQITRQAWSRSDEQLSRYTKVISSVLQMCTTTLTANLLASWGEHANIRTVTLQRSCVSATCSRVFPRHPLLWAAADMTPCSLLSVFSEHWFLLVSTQASCRVSEACGILSISKRTDRGCPKAIHRIWIRISTDWGFFLLF